MIDFKAYLEKLKSGEVASTSKYSLRDESSQTKFRGLGIPRFKKEKDLKCKLLIINEFASPFNPISLEDGDICYENKFRPEQSFTSVVGAIKVACEQDVDLKAKVMDNLGLTSWDTSVATVGKADIDALSKVRVPRVFTFNVIGIMSQILNNNSFSNDYKINWETNELGEPIGDYPTLLRLNSMFLTSLLEEYKEWESENVTKSEKDKKEQKRVFLGRNPVGNDRPKNFVIAIKVPVDNKTKVSPEVATWTAEDVKKNLVHLSYSGDFKTTLDTLIDTYQESRDTYPDFYEIDVIVGSEEDAGQRAMNAQYKNSEFKISESMNCDKFIPAVTEMLDSIENLEGTVIKATRLRDMDSNTEEKLMEALGREFDIKSLKITNQLVDRYADLISDIWGDAGDELIMEADSGLGKDSSLKESDVIEAKKDLKEILSESEEIDMFEE